MRRAVEKRADENRGLVAKLVLLAVGMFAFGVFALPPLYDVFCEITGLGGKTAPRAAENVSETPDPARDIRLEFVTTVNQYAPYRFEPAADGVTVHPGGLYEAIFIAENLTNRARVAQAVPSVAPAPAAEHFRKLECFCFSEQTFAPGEIKAMPVRFIVSSKLPDYIDTISLSYTFFDITEPGPVPEAAGTGHLDHATR